MTDVIPAEPLKSVLTAYCKAHGVVDYLRIRLGNEERSLEDVHRSVALFGMRVIDWRTCEYYKVAEDQRHMVFYKLFWCGMQFDNLSSAAFTHLKIDEAKMVSRAEDPKPFTEEHRYAFLEPPYSLSVNREIAEVMFADINKLLIGEIAEWTIRKWSDDWSSYFDSGKEWWGAFLWTLARPNSREAIWIGASTTD